MSCAHRTVPNSRVSPGHGGDVPSAPGALLGQEERHLPPPVVLNDDVGDNSTGHEIHDLEEAVHIVQLGGQRRKNVEYGGRIVARNDNLLSDLKHSQSGLKDEVEHGRNFIQAQKWLTITRNHKLACLEQHFRAIEKKQIPQSDDHLYVHDTGVACEEPVECNETDFDVVFLKLGIDLRQSRSDESAENQLIGLCSN